jgi:pilus assembly protein FimV
MADRMANLSVELPEKDTNGRWAGPGVSKHMAFGFGFNKQKALSAAEKFVQQGKLQNAIAEYEKVLKADPKELTVSNTIGDLHARLGQSDKAIESFKSVGDAYAAQGFTVKAIAMYKKLTKLKPTLEIVLRLAELYTQQGLFNDARAQYLQVAEEFLRSGELEQAVRIFQKTLEMDPENVAMRTRLAEVYVRLNKKTEAWQLFAAAADSLRTRGQLGPAEEILNRMLTLDPSNSQALLLRGRNAFDSGDMAGTIKNLEKVADLDSHPEGLRALMQAYLQTGRLPEAGTLAAKLCTVHNDTGAITGYADALMAAGNVTEVLQVYQLYSDRLVSTDSTKVIETLHSLIGPMRENTPALETILDLSQKAGDSSHMTEIYELLAHACVHSGKLDKARDYYLRLTQLEPQNQLHTRNYQQVLAKLGGGAPGARLITAEEGAVLVEELEATAPFIDQRYPDEIALAVRAALTDAELFVSYNMPAKALGPLLSALPKAPRDLRLNQRLAALHTRAGRFSEAAVCCRNLEQLFHDAGHPDEATRYKELADKYEERTSNKAVAAEQIEVSSVAPSEPAQIEPKARPYDGTAQAVPAPEPAASGLFFHKAAAFPRSVSSEFEVRAEPPAAENEIDISAEWEGELSDEPVAASLSQEQAEDSAEVSHGESVQAQAVKETIEELRFYLAHSMPEQARVVFAKLEKLKPGAAQLAQVWQEIEAAEATTHAKQAQPAEEISVEEADDIQAEEIEAPSVARSKPDREFVADLHSAADAIPAEEFLPKMPIRTIVPTPEPARAEYAQASAAVEPAGVLGEFVSDLEASLGDGFLPPAPPTRAPEPQPRAASESAAVISAQTISAQTISAQAISGHAISGHSAAASAPAPALESQATAAYPTFTYQPTKKRTLAPEVSPAAAKVDAASVDLADMFGELKQELEDDAANTQEDPETHYNLGVAFREMGLLDEAIGELQKVCQAVDRGHDFPQLMQTYTWLAQCFLDKGVPEAAIRWYSSALKLPRIDEETRTALNYELASSYEAAGNKPVALTHFMEVYGSNIDYRDVAERIKALKS